MHCCYAGCRNTEHGDLVIVMQNAIILSVIMLNVNMLDVIALHSALLAL
jgi:hypothetical protein